jgi:hypothetical protein
VNPCLSILCTKSLGVNWYLVPTSIPVSGCDSFCTRLDDPIKPRIEFKNSSVLFDEIHIDASSKSSLIEPNCFSNFVYSLKVVKLNNLLREPIEIEPSSMEFITKN